jgi:hypothetical protein
MQNAPPRGAARCPERVANAIGSADRKSNSYMSLKMAVAKLADDRIKLAKKGNPELWL